MLASGAAIVADIPAPLQVLSPERSDAKHHRGVRRQTLFFCPTRPHTKKLSKRNKSFEEKKEEIKKN